MDAYRRAAPNPEDFPVLVEKLKTFFGQEYAWPEEDLRSITAPTLLMIGDSDIVRPEHEMELFRLLGGGVPAIWSVSRHPSWPSCPAPPTHRS